MILSALKRSVRQNPAINAFWLLPIVALFLTITANDAFFMHAAETYPLTDYLGFAVSLALVLTGVLLLLLSLLCYKFLFKFILIAFILLASVTGYFTDTYGTIYDAQMMQNVLETDQAEMMGLFNREFLLRISLLGIIPSIIIAWQKIYFPRFSAALLTRFAVILSSLLLIALPIATFSKTYASFFREHKTLRLYTNPVAPIYAVGKLLHTEYRKHTAPKNTIMHAADAVQISSPAERAPKLIVMVVGETLRADHVSLNGYARNTFPQVSQIQGVTNFSHVISCGTSTAYSLPCMFGYFEIKDYDVAQAPYHENVLDTINRLKINILWKDNNSDDKGAMHQLPPSDYVKLTRDHCPDGAAHECRDIHLLTGLDDYVANHQQQDILIVLHQMGNHGPEYYKRYDAAFERFTPVCKSNELAKCTRQEVINAFDNAVLMTDDFLAKTIHWLNQYDQTHQVALLYVSDHGESLGEKGVYLHGMPYRIAPIEQKHVASFFWTGAHAHFRAVPSNTTLTHAAIAATLLKLFDIKTQAIEYKSSYVL